MASSKRKCARCRKPLDRRGFLCSACEEKQAAWLKRGAERLRKGGDTLLSLRFGLDK